MNGKPLNETMFLSQEELDELATKANDAMKQTAEGMAKSAASDARNNAPRHEPPVKEPDESLDFVESCGECSGGLLDFFPDYWP